MPPAASLNRSRRKPSEDKDANPLDHNTPAPLRHSLPGHTVEIAYERGWAELTNGDLLAMAESAGFDLLITTDKSIRYQQNLSGRKLSLLVLSTNDWTHIRQFKEL